MCGGAGCTLDVAMRVTTGVTTGAATVDIGGKDLLLTGRMEWCKVEEVGVGECAVEETREVEMGRVDGSGVGGRGRCEDEAGGDVGREDEDDGGGMYEGM